MPPKGKWQVMSQSNLHPQQCGADWYSDWSEFESPPQPPQLPDWACEPKWVIEFQDFIKGPLGYFAWKLATETDPTPQTPVANVLLGLQQMVQGLRDAWGKTTTTFYTCKAGSFLTIYWGGKLGIVREYAENECFQAQVGWTVDCGWSSRGVV